MRRLILGIIGLTFTTLVGGTAEGQIRMLPGPQRLVAQAPKFITAGFFNNDQFEDAAVTNSISTKITVLLGQESGTSFGQVTDFNVGRVLRGLSSGDLNGDTFPNGPLKDKPILDLAVTDLLDNKVFVCLGNGDGTFSVQPQLGYKVGANPIDAAVGDFDNQKGSDLVVVDQGINKVSVLLNLGGKAGFGAASPFSVGGLPKRVVTGDLTGDKLDDIVVVNTGTRAADDISVLLNNGIGGFNPQAKFLVGAGAVDVAIADFNDDGVPDLAVLNAGIVSVQTNYTISILINQTTTVNGKKVGTGFFIGETPITISCPATINGIAISCRPSYVAAADFDNDGFNDLAITVATQPTAGSGGAMTSGLVQAFQGHGDGTFAFSSQVAVGNNPQGIVAGDFNGDGISDVAIAEQGSISVRIINMLPPPLLDNGTACHLGRQCSSGSCVDGVCCGSLSCPDGQFCDIPGSVGTCELPNPIPAKCTDGHQCETDFCVDGFCCNFPTCPTGQFCNNPDGTCHPPADNGIPCDSTDSSGGNDQCASGHCTDGVCCQDDRCASGFACNIPGSEGVCTLKLPVGSPCTVDAQCAPPTSDDTTGFCTDGFCCGVRTCPTGQSCGEPGKGGFCAVAPTSTPTASTTATNTPTPTPQPIGLPCSIGAQCAAPHACLDGICCSSTSCPAGQFCNISGSLGICAPKEGTGNGCGGDQDCLSGNCDTGSSTCQGTRTPTPTPTPKPGDPCTDSSQCPLNFSCNLADGGICCNFGICPTGEACNTTINPGFCTLLPTPSPTLTPLPPLGSPCTSGDECDSGFCTDGVCCTDNPCPVGDLCNIFLSEGICTPPGNTGDPCNKNTDCNPLLECDRNTNSCVVPVPTPSFPDPTATAGPGLTAHTSSSGGCSINAGSDRSVLWLLAALPLILGTRRYRLHHASVRSPRVRRTRNGR